MRIGKGTFDGRTGVATAIGAVAGASLEACREVIAAKRKGESVKLSGGKIAGAGLAGAALAAGGELLASHLSEAKRASPAQLSGASASSVPVPSRADPLTGPPRTVPKLRSPAPEFRSSSVAPRASPPGTTGPSTAELAAKLRPAIPF